MIHKWFHKYIRLRTNPIPEDRALLWKKRLSIAYGLIAWNTFGLVIYMTFQGKSDWAHYYGLKSDDEKEMAPGMAWAKTLKIPNATVYRISGVQKVDQYEIVNGEEVRQKIPSREEEELLKE